MFTSVNYQDLGTTVAQVNRKTGALFINPAIWQNLPQEYKNYVLMHEEGHLKLQTADEYEANKYAVGRFVEAGVLTDDEFGRRIVVLSEILGDKGRETFFKNTNADISGFAISGVTGAINSVFQSLSILGVGSNKRIEENNAAAENAVKVENAKSQATQRALIIGGLFLVVTVILFLTLKK